MANFLPLSKYVRSMIYQKKHFFKYLQLKHFISSTNKDPMSESPLTNLENLIITNLAKRGLVSLFYETLISHEKVSSKDWLEACKVYIGEDILEEDWEVACLKAYQNTINTRLKLLQYKWLMWTCITPVKLNKTCQNIPDICCKCFQEKGTLFCCVWECSEVQSFWQNVMGPFPRWWVRMFPCKPNSVSWVYTLKIWSSVQNNQYWLILGFFKLDDWSRFSGKTYYCPIFGISGGWECYNKWRSSSYHCCCFFSYLFVFIYFCYYCELLIFVV